MANPEMSPEMRGTIKQYLELQREERRIKEEKALLQRKLLAMCKAAQVRRWEVRVDNQDLVVRHRVSRSVDCDVEALRERLGERYGLICSPNAAAIRRAVEAGQVTREELRGLVRSKDRDFVTVGRPFAGEKERGKAAVA